MAVRGLRATALAELPEPVEGVVAGARHLRPRIAKDRLDVVRGDGCAEGRDDVRAGRGWRAAARSLPGAAGRRRAMDAAGGHGRRERGDGDEQRQLQLPNADGAATDHVAQFRLRSLAHAVGWKRARDARARRQFLAAVYILYTWKFRIPHKCNEFVPILKSASRTYMQADHLVEQLAPFPTETGLQQA